MGITNFADFVAFVQPSALVEVKKGGSKKPSDNAFARAGAAGQAVVMDGMTHVFTLAASLGWKNKQPEKYSVTGVDVVQAFFRRILDYFDTYFKLETTPQTQRPPPVLVLVMDKPLYVNPGKAACQKKRASQNKQQGYGPRVCFYPGGVRPDPSSVLQSIDVATLLATRGAGRQTFYRFLLDSLVTHPQPLKWPPSTQLLVDCEGGVRVFLATEQGDLYEWKPVSSVGAVASNDTTDVVAAERPKPVIDPLRGLNRLGEADLAAVRWVLLLKRPVRLITTDTDWAMLHMFHLWHRLEKTPEVLWDNNGGIQRFHVHRAVESLRDKHHFTREAIVALAIFSGCDYFEKSDATKQIGHKHIYQGLRDYMRAHGPRSGKPRPALGTLEGMRDALWHIYAACLDCAPTEDSLRTSKRKHVNMNLVLDPDSLADVFVSYKLALDYFCMFVSWDPAKDPALVMPGVRLDASMRITCMQLLRR